MLNKKILKNNQNLAINISLFKDFLPGKRALVFKDYMPDLDGKVAGDFAITDFFDVVIAETPEAAKSVKTPDFIVYSSDSPYKNNILHIDCLFEYTNSIIVSNFEALRACSKLRRVLPIYNVNYLVASHGPSKHPKQVHGVDCGLAEDGPGVHLALLMGSTEIYYTGTSTITYEYLVEFVERNDGALSTNLIQPKRRPILLSKL